MIYDGFKTLKAIVADCCLIDRLDLKYQLSGSGEICYDLPLHPLKYKGLYIAGFPERGAPGSYYFKIRGSLIRFANQGIHNDDFKGPFELLDVINELVTDLRIDPFRTMLNNLELSVTIPAESPLYVVQNILSYQNKRPNLTDFRVDRLGMKYAEVTSGQHTLKLYPKSREDLRFEMKINKMQSIKKDGPLTLADLANPAFAGPMASKLLKAFGQILWYCTDMDIDGLSAGERDLILRGRDYAYWKVDGGFGHSYHAVRKARQREKKHFKRINAREWRRGETPEKLRDRMTDRLNEFKRIMQSLAYREAYRQCLDRWEGIVARPNGAPNIISAPPMSQSYCLSTGNIATSRFPAQ